MRMLFRCFILALMQLTVLLTAQTTGTTEEQEEQEFVIAIGDGFINLHPHQSFTVTEAQLFTGIYEGLVSYDPITLSPEAAVARRWDISDDGLVYTFHLRDNAVYRNGDPVTAHDFRNAWIASLSPQANSYFSVLFDVIAGAQDYRNGVHDDPEQIGIVAIDEYTLEITLSAPAPFFLSTLCHYSFSPIHPRMLRVQDWNTFPLLLTNGPYILKKFSEEEIILTQSNNYWDYDKDNFAQIRYMRVEGGDNLFDEYVTSEVDWIISGFGADLTRYNNALHVNPVLGTSFYFFVAAQPPWDDPILRRALALAIPWSEIRSSERYNYPTATLVPPISDYTQPTGIVEQNTEEALQLLSDNDYPLQDGSGTKTLPPIILSFPDNSEERRVAGLIATAWEELLRVEVIQRFVPGVEYFEHLETAQDYTIGKVSWIGDYLDPLAFLQLWGSDSNLNYADYRSTGYDMLLQEAAESEDSTERFAILQEAESTILDNGLILPINHSIAINIIDTDRIRGWHTNILDIHPLKAIKQKRGFFLPNLALHSR